MLATLSVSARPSDGSRLAIVGVDVLTPDGAGFERLEDRTVLVQGGRVQAVSEGSQLSGDALVIEGCGRTLLPGLCDAAVHLEDSGELDLALAHGVTMVRVLDGRRAHLDLRAEIEAGRPGPRLWIAARVPSDASPPRAAQFVHDAAAAGYDGIGFERGVGRPSWEAAMAAAMRNRLPVIGEPPRQVSTADALARGQASLEPLEAALGDYLSAGLPEPDELEQLAERWCGEGAATGTGLARLGAQMSAARSRSAMLRSPEIDYVVPHWRSILGPAGHGLRRNLGVEDLPEVERGLERQRALLLDLTARGVPLLVGSHALSSFTLPGVGLHDELAQLVEAGLGREQVLYAAVRALPDWLGRGDLGRVEAGVLADLVLVEGDPLAELGRLERPVGVLIQGRWLPREELDRRVEGVRETYVRDEGRIDHVVSRGRLRRAIERHAASGASESFLREETYERLCELLTLAGRRGDALRIGRLAVAEWPDAWWSHLRLAEAAANVRAWEEAAKHVERAAALRPALAEVRRLAARVRAAIEREER